ncbi:hypothetical protein WT83_04870 [Burkholderia territorii]|uniref:Uncharacterized protein n=1 Tax=Burkholderia territorii TaxID=1503055 RepID=A0A119VNZ1_9BURK|nr:hypothetical protein [Burkholderia territorii]KWN22007.1 hypothetical protein WT83_04870 [Burkholderia territorii]
MIQSRKALIVALAALAVVSAGAYYAARTLNESGQAPVAVKTPPLAHVASEPSAFARAPAEMASGSALELTDASKSAQVPGSASAGGPGGPAVSTPGAPSEQEQQRQAALQQALQKMQALLNSGQRDPATVAAALADAEKANGSPIMGGVNLEALRNNMQVLGQMQQIAQQMQGMEALQNGASQVDAQAQAAFMEKRSQLMALQRQMRSDIMAPGQGPAAATGQVPTIPRGQ